MQPYLDIIIYVVYKPNIVIDCTYNYSDLQLKAMIVQIREQPKLYI